LRHASGASRRACRERTKQSKQKRLAFEVSLLRILTRLQGFRVRTASVPGKRIILISRPACGSIITHNLEKLMQSLLRKSLIVSGIALSAAAFGQNASADSSDNLRWQSVIGIAAPNNVVGVGTGAITGGPTPWSTLGGHVNVDLTKSRITFDVRGLVLAGGNSIGTPGAVAQVKGTLLCDTDGSAGDTFFVDTPLVDLSEQGEAQFTGRVSALPAVCSTEPDVAFLIRVGAGKWIANAIVLR
jgi:hypothetical protein